MSRVYEALRQFQDDTGAQASILDPDNFLATEAAPHPTTANGTIAWDEIASFEPHPKSESRVVTLTDDNSLGAEKFRLLRARIRHIRETQQVRRFVVTSAVPDEGKTLVSINLAIALAQHTTDRVLLLEGDLRKPTFAQYLNMPNVAGLDDWFSSNSPVTKFLHHLDDLQLWLLPAGVPQENPVMILQSARFAELYNELSAAFDWIVIDAPPLLPMVDVNFWSRKSDGLLLVSRQGRTPKLALKKGLEVLDHPKVLGVVINDSPAVENSYYHHYYYGTSKSFPRKK
ncbi:MAG TPA: CpsD/CapB family tyrosine-protein kinase [Terriglobales bacterium]|nr:CpsD/CapB family tyrosine-protein kinase [Terriglobales bacterium]